MLDLFPPSPSAGADRRPVYSVSQLNREARTLLEKAFPLIWIEGEISNLACPASGHWYFTLKDSQAQVRCAMFRNRNQLLRFRPKDGMHVLARVQISLFEGRGEFQLIVEHLEEAGEGALQRAFEALKLKLQAEGLFDAARKRPLPRWPRRVGVITSPTGAAVRDILSTLQRRWPRLAVCVYPVAVQGAEAVPAIVAALARASARRQEDVLILARGGGSLEDLWAFNDEAVARAICDCAIPVVSGVGHEIDFTIADLAADLRAPTPTAAAELVSQDVAEWLPRTRELEARLALAMRRRLNDGSQRLDGLQQRLQHPGSRIRQMRQRVEELHLRLAYQMQRGLQHDKLRLQRARDNLLRCGPARQLPLLRQQLARAEHGLARLGRQTVAMHRERAHQWVRQLDLVSPLKVLDRGYAIVSDERNCIVQDSSQVSVGERIGVRLARGHLHCRVEESAAEAAPQPPEICD